MPIKVQCACGKAFAAKDELAGKTVKCPGCQQPLKIPGSSPAAAKAPVKPEGAKPPAPVPAGAKSTAVKPAAAKPAPGAAARPAPAPVASDSLFDEIGLQPAAAGTRPCPGCTEPMPIEAVVCIKCGYNTNLGRRMQTMKVGGDAGAGGHSAVVEDLMNRAAETMDGDVEEEKKKTKAGMPWWVYLILLALLFAFGTWMLKPWEKEVPKEGTKGSYYRPQGPPAGYACEPGSRGIPSPPRTRIPAVPLA
jgi:hypothetical protein